MAGGSAQRGTLCNKNPALAPVTLELPPTPVSVRIPPPAAAAIALDIAKSRDRSEVDPVLEAGRHLFGCNYFLNVFYGPAPAS